MNCTTGTCNLPCAGTAGCQRIMYLNGCGKAKKSKVGRKAARKVKRHCPLRASSEKRETRAQLLRRMACVRAGRKL